MTDFETVKNTYDYYKCAYDMIKKSGMRDKNLKEFIIENFAQSKIKYDKYKQSNPEYFI